MNCQKTSERKKILQSRHEWSLCAEKSALAARAALYDHSAEIFVLWVNSHHLGILRLSVPLYIQLQRTVSSILWKDDVHRFLSFKFFSPRLLQSCNVGPENRSGSPWRTCENESSSCGRAHGKTWSHVDPSGVTLVYMPVHWHSSSGGNWLTLSSLTTHLIISFVLL